MDGTELPHLLFRWLHVLAGVMWIGQIWSLTLVHQLPQDQPYDSSLSTLMLRAHNWLRWSATLTWFAGFALLGIVYYGGGALTGAQQSAGLAMGVGIAVLVLGWPLYDAIWTHLGRHAAAAAMVSLALFTGVAAGLPRIMTGRAAFIHLGAMLATIMLANVWQRIWPIERRRLTATDSRQRPSHDAVAGAALRLRHNAALAVAVILFMISNHFPLVYGHTLGWIAAPGIVVSGWLATGLFNVRAKSPVVRHA
jgi:uncharacterized membrane protein